MGLFDFLKSGKKENKAMEHGFISGGGKGLSFEEANKAREAFMQLIDTSDDQSKLFNAASGMMLGKNFDGAIEAFGKLAEKYPERAETCESQIGAAWYFKGDYDKAINHYVNALNKGADAGMMDDNVWEAAEALYNKNNDKAPIQKYLSIFPDGQYVKKANKLMG